MCIKTALQLHFSKVEALRASHRLTCRRVSRLHGEIKDKRRCCFEDQTTSASALLPDPGGGGDIPPGHGNETDRVTCQCPALHTAAWASTGAGRRGCSGNVAGAIIAPHWLIQQTTTPMTLTSYPVVASAQNHQRALFIPFAPNCTTKWSVINSKSSQVPFEI